MIWYLATSSPELSLLPSFTTGSCEFLASVFMGDSLLLPPSRSVGTPPSSAAMKRPEEDALEEAVSCPDSGSERDLLVLLLLLTVAASDKSGAITVATAVSSLSAMRKEESVAKDCALSFLAFLPSAGSGCGGGVWKSETALPLLSRLTKTEESRCWQLRGRKVMEETPDSASAL